MDAFFCTFFPNLTSVPCFPQNQCLYSHLVCLEVCPPSSVLICLPISTTSASRDFKNSSERCFYMFMKTDGFGRCRGNFICTPRENKEQLLEQLCYKVFVFVLAKDKVFVFANSSCILQIHVENEASLVLLLVELIINLWQGFILQAVVAKFS